MKAIELYKFISDKCIEYHWTDDNEDVIIMPFMHDIVYFCDLTKRFIDCSGSDGIDAKLRNGYFCVHMKEICDFYDIELIEVFDK